MIRTDSWFPKSLLVLPAALALLGGLAPSAAAQANRAVFEAGGNHLVLHALDEDLIHFEFGAGQAPDAAPAASIMVLKRDYPGAKSFARTANGVQTADVAVSVAAATLCFTLTDRARDTELTTICPADATKDEKGLTLTPNRIRNVYGLGEEFVTPGEMNGDWVGRERKPGVEYGNRMIGFHGGMVGNAMFPIMYAVGDAGINYALFVDNTYAQRWDFRTAPWSMRTRGELRGYVMTGPNLPDLRRDYMELVGAPPVPPRKAFGLWVSEFGFENWYELETKLATLREHRFPVDGFVLDLQWFGGIITGADISPMGSLSWDLKRFPDPAGYIARLRTEQGLGVIPIEEPYISKALAEHDTLAARGFMPRLGENGAPVYLTANPWWGKGSMMDFTNDAGSTFWHDWKRQPLVEAGVTGHWTDLGEPEIYDSTAWYHGVVPGRHAHADVHNVFNMKWSQSVFDGYRRHGVRRRPLILSRSGISGIQRYGVAMWSGDIGANAASLATHMNAQMHMSMSGMDYFGSNIGGFHRGSIQGDSLTELYTQWFAAGALLDVPVRVHAENLCNCKETAPDRVGHRASNLANLRLRYSLTPYYYALAHRARLFAEPLVAPLVYHYQDDAAVRELGDEKLIGQDLLVAAVAQHGQQQRDVYLPRGTWYDFHTNARHEGGQWVRNVPLYRDSLFRLPLYARAGAIIPRMHVDEQSMNVLGKRLDGSTRDALVARVYPHAAESQFVLYEDDGETIAYQDGAVATTTLSQRSAPGRVTVVVGAREGTYDGAPAQRDNVIELVAGDARVGSVRVNGTALAQHPSREAFERAGSGWYDAGNGVVIARSGTRPVGQVKTFEFRTSAAGRIGRGGK
ncbi:MAG TPA: TIM-barrel domain-containing protein [Gemmatimonadaceae bacterium]|nr:TIM-barrel domain-containing protein [Gemmatimonadaceae bacterium]